MLEKCPFCGKLWKKASFNLHFGRCKANRSGGGSGKRKRPLFEKGERPTKLPRREDSRERQETGETLDQVSPPFAGVVFMLNGALQLPEQPEFVVGSSGRVPELEQPVPELPQSPIPVSVSRSGRVRRPPRALQDFLPSSTGGLPAHILTRVQPAQPTPSSPSRRPLPPNPRPQSLHIPALRGLRTPGARPLCPQKWSRLKRTTLGCSGGILSPPDVNPLRKQVSMKCATTRSFSEPAASLRGAPCAGLVASLLSEYDRKP